MGVSQTMRIGFSLLFTILIGSLVACAFMAYRSHKSIGRSVALLMCALIPPVIGNLVIIVSTNELLSTFGYYVYFLGMDLVMFALVHFTAEYCAIEWPNKVLRNLFYAVLAIDVFQYLLNPFFGQAFGTEAVMVEGLSYYRLLPYIGQTFHRLLDYSIFIGVLIVFLVKAIRTPRITAERYWLILVSMAAIGLWQTFYIFSRTPVDRSMIGYGVFGLLVYYFALRYRAMRLLDRMLATVASQMPEALYFFDSTGQCIWANNQGRELVHIGEEEFDRAPTLLRQMLSLTEEGDEWSTVRSIGTGDALKSYIVEKHAITDEKGRLAGYFVIVRDNTNEERKLRREMENAAHDSLTKVYNRAGYEVLLSRMDLSTSCMILLDIDFFKTVNDTYGHEMGDKILQKVANIALDRFRSDDRVSRIGGDEFVVLMTHSGQRQSELIGLRIQQINEGLADTSDGLPAVSISAGVAYGQDAGDSTELFNHADEALYETKRNGRNGYTIYGEQNAIPGQRGQSPLAPK